MIIIMTWVAVSQSVSVVVTVSMTQSQVKAWLAMSSSYISLLIFRLSSSFVTYYSAAVKFTSHPSVLEK